MGISNVSNGLRSGVCTSTTRPTAPYEGQMIYETDTNRVLVYDNTAWVMIADTDTPPGLEFIKSVTVSAASTLSVDNCFSSTYTNYLVQFNGRSASNNDISLNLKMRLSGTDTSTSTDYRWTQIQNYSTTVSASGNNSVGQYQVGAISQTDTSYRIEVLNPNSATLTTFNGQGVNVQTAFSNALDTYRTMGILNNSTQYDGFTLFCGSGTLTGTARVYGYRI